MNDGNVLLNRLAVSKLDLRCSRLIRNECLGVWHKTAGESALGRLVQNLPLVLQQELDHGDFDLIARKESSRAGMQTMSKAILLGR